jgi:hypothetical protein
MHDDEYLPDGRVDSDEDSTRRKGKRNKKGGSPKLSWKGISFEVVLKCIHFIN